VRAQKRSALRRTLLASAGAVAVTTASAIVSSLRRREAGSRAGRG
jgi:hypothetical protein